MIKKQAQVKEMKAQRKEVDVAEVYSPPQVVREAECYGLETGASMDLTTGWDFTREEDREEARRYVEEHKPRVLIGSPACTMLSTLQNLSGWDQENRGGGSKP